MAVRSFGGKKKQSFKHSRLVGFKPTPNTGAAHWKKSLSRMSAIELYDELYKVSKLHQKDGSPFKGPAMHLSKKTLENLVQYHGKGHEIGIKHIRPYVENLILQAKIELLRKGIKVK